jgi:hypothetical protein
MANYKDLRYVFPASSIASGTFADARIAASNVSQHATSFDDNKIVNDISTLGLRVHTQENLNASNTNSASFDVFQDSSGITGLTNAARDGDGEYVSTGVLNYNVFNTGLFTSGQGGSASAPTNTSGTSVWNSGNFSYLFDGLITDANAVFLTSNNGGDQRNRELIFDFGSSKRINKVKMHQWDAASGPTNTGSVDSFTLEVSNDNSSYTTVKTVTNQAEYAVATGEEHDLSSSTIDHRYFKIKSANASTNNPPGGNSNSNAQHWGMSEIFFYQAGQSFSATGSFEGNAITASSTNKMGAVITYQDFLGTNALNTDIVLKLSADNGSNYSTATLTALPDFATGIKMAKVNDLSVTAGTQLKYKIEFANQAEGSKEARIRGVSLQY